VTGFADDRVGIGREGIDGGSAGKGEHADFERLAVLGGENLFAVVLGGVTEDTGPFFAESNGLPGLDFITGDDPNIFAAAGGSFDNGIIGIRVGQTRLTAFEAKPEARFVILPAELVRREIFLKREHWLIRRDRVRPRFF
jgi:hypothetical protein